MSDAPIFVKKTFRVSTAKLKTKLDGRPLTANLDLNAKIYGVEIFYRGYIKALDRLNKFKGRRIVKFEWEKKSATTFQVTVFAQPKLSMSRGEGGSGTQNPPPTGSKPPNL